MKGGKWTKGQSYACKIWETQKISKCYTRHLKYGSLWLTGPICELKTACVRRRRADEKGEGGFLTGTSKSLTDSLLKLFKAIKLLAFARKVPISSTVLNEHWTPRAPGTPSFFLVASLFCNSLKPEVCKDSTSATLPSPLVCSWAHCTNSSLRSLPFSLFFNTHGGSYHSLAIRDLVLQAITTISPLLFHLSVSEENPRRTRPGLAALDTHQLCLALAPAVLSWLSPQVGTGSLWKAPQVIKLQFPTLAAVFCLDQPA